MWTNLLTDVFLPIATLLLGWLSSSYRNRQQKEKSVLDNVQQILDMKTKEVERAQSEVDRANKINDRQEAVVQRLECKLDRQDKAIRKARNCEFVKSGHECPVIAADEKFHIAQGASCEDCKKEIDE